MKLVYLQQHYSMPDEPGFVRPWQFSKRFVQAGMTVTAVRGTQAATEHYRDGVRVRSVAASYANEMGFARRLVAFGQYLWKATLHVLREKPDIVYASSGPLTVAVPALIASAKRSTRLVFEVRDLWPEVPIALGILRNPVLKAVSRLLAKATYGRADLVVCLSPDMERGVLAVSPEANTVVIPNGCDFDLFDAAAKSSQRRRLELGLKESDVLVGYAGGFGYMYDLEWPVRLAARLYQSDVRTFFIGHGAESVRLRELADEIGLPRESFLGLKSKSEVAEYLSAADVILSPLRDDRSLEACSLNKVFDAMAAGKPVLFNHGGWLTEAVTSVGGGWRLSRDLEEANAQVQGILREYGREGLQQAGANTRALGISSFDRDRQFDELLDRIRLVVK